MMRADMIVRAASVMGVGADELLIDKVADATNEEGELNGNSRNQ